MRTQYIDIPKWELDEYQDFLNAPGQNSDSVMKMWSANFGGGLEVDIKICDVSEDTTPYIDAVMFQDGSEIGLLDVSEELAGEYIFDDPDNQGEKLQVIVRAVKS
jgi:hypothetical protein